MDDKKNNGVPSNDDVNELIRIKKIKQGLIPDTENEKYLAEKEAQKQRPVSIGEKGANFWYHYKWTVIIISAAVLVAGFLIFQALTNEKYDSTVFLCTHDYFSDDAIESLTDELSKYFDDINQDGKVNVAVFQAQYKKNPNDDENYDSSLRARIMAEIANGENCLFIVEEDIYKDFSEKGVFAKLDDGSFGYPVSDTDVMSAAEFKSVRDKCYVALRVYRNGSDKENYEGQKSAFLKIYKK